MSLKAFILVALTLLGLHVFAQGQGSSSVSNETRVFTHSRAEEKDRQGESDGDAILAFLDIAIRHEKPSASSFAAIVARANSAKTGGLLDKDLFKKLGATYAYDFFRHEEEHVKHESEQDKRLLNLEAQVKELLSQANQLKEEHKKTP